MRGGGGDGIATTLRASDGFSTVDNALGTVQDGTYLKKSGATIVGDTPLMPASQRLDIALGIDWFSNFSMLPGTLLARNEFGVPTGKTDVGAGSTATPSGGMVHTGPRLSYWDLGAARSKVLIIVGGVTFGSAAGLSMSIGLADALPTGLDPNGYGCWLGQAYSDDARIYKTTAGPTYTLLASGTDVAPNPQRAALAMYYDYSGGVRTIRMFMRLSGSGWIQVAESTADTAYTTFRYPLFQGADTGNTWFAGPMAIYYE